MNQQTNDHIILDLAGTGFMNGARAIVLQHDETVDGLFRSAHESIKIDDKGTFPPVVPWGEDNLLPSQIMDKVGKNVFMSSNMFFNINTAYGSGILPVRKIIQPEGQIEFIPYEGDEAVDIFFEENRTDIYLLEQLNDLMYFHNVFPEIIFNKESGDKRKIVMINSKEAFFSRWSEIETKGVDKGRIKYHYYYADWDKKIEIDKVIKTRVLDRISPLRHLRNIMEEEKSLAVEKRTNRLIVPVSFPTPGRPYYAKPYWFSIFESGLYDFAQKIMPFKNAMMDNMANIKYVIELGPNYFEEIFRREKITDDKKKEKRIKDEYADFNKFLRDVKNTNKSIITHQKLDPRGEPYPMVKITQLKTEAGGELLADHEEVANIISYGMNVHPSLVGPAAGKAKMINGTEARELYIIKQAQFKPIRDLLLYPFYLIKAINGWPKDLHFSIPNIELTTLDKNKSGSQTMIPSE